MVKLLKRRRNLITVLYNEDILCPYHQHVILLTLKISLVQCQMEKQP